MNSSLPIITAGALLVAGGGSDLARRRVPNAVSGGVLLAGLGVQLSKGPASAALALLGGLLLGAALTLAWRARLVGGGDVKLAAAAGVCAGWSGLPLYLAATALAGGVVSVVCYAASPPQAQARVRSSLTAVALGLGPGSGAPGQRVSVPYGVAIAAGALIALWRT